MVVGVSESSWFYSSRLCLSLSLYLSLTLSIKHHGAALDQCSLFLCVNRKDRVTSSLCDVTKGTDRTIGLVLQLHQAPSYSLMK